MTWAVAGGLGPVLGGAFSTYLSWRWIFWLNLPVCGMAFALLLLFLDVHNPRTKFVDGVKAVDWAGSVSLIGLMVMVLLGLNFGGATFPWDSPKVICLVVFGCLMAILFLFNEGRLARYPIMPLGLFRRRSNAACLIIVFIQHFVRVFQVFGRHDLSLTMTTGSQFRRILSPTIFPSGKRSLTYLFRGFASPIDNDRSCYRHCLGDLHPPFW